MSIRSSAASSILRSAAVALCLIAAVTPAAAQLDAISEEARKDPFILIRLAALSLETPEEQGEALSGLVQAELARGDLQEATKELSRITDGYWQAASLIKLADYQIEKKRKTEALAALNDAIGAAAKARENPETEHLVREIAVRRNALGDEAGAVTTTKLIRDTKLRIETLLEIGRPSLQDKTSKGNKGALIEASRQTRTIKDDEPEVARLLLIIGEAQTRLGDTKQADATLSEARRMILQSEFTGREQALAELAAAETEAGDQTRAMVLVRSIADPERRVRALGSVARAIGEGGNMDAAVTLFTFAIETTTGIEDETLRNSLLTHLVVEQARTGRLADAFKTAGLIRKKRAQAEALAKMGHVLLEQQKYDDALKLTDYIPYLGLRGLIFAPVALATGNRGEHTEASALLARALEPVREPSDPELQEQALNDVLATQILVGDPETSQALFDRARNLIDSLPDGLGRVRLLTFLARALAQNADKEKATQVIDAASRITWGKSGDPDYPRSVARIVEALLASDRLLEAFNTASRIPDTDAITEIRLSQTPRNRLLTLVAQAAAKIGKVELAIRAARKIRDPASRAAALGAVAVGISHS
ncbi:MAG: hypothetical protein O3B08_10110 [Proteobacteria bacterium]|nr:hypothetical protein [Pseudomonadota bacterium]